MVEVVPSGGAAATGADPRGRGGLLSGDTFPLGGLTDHELVEKIKRIRKHIALGYPAKLPDKGAALSANVRRLQEELERRRSLPRAGKDKDEEECREIKRSTSGSSRERKRKGNAETSVVDGGQVSQTNEMETDLSVVMSAWYSAGFYTGRNKRLQGSKETDRTTFLLAPQRPLLQFPLSSVIRGPQRDGLWANALIPDMEGSAPMVEDEEECREIKRSTSGSSRERKRKGNAETSVVDGGQVSQTNEMETNLSVVMSAWYSAGFYTGRYLLEQSMKKGSRRFHRWMAFLTTCCHCE